MEPAPLMRTIRLTPGFLFGHEFRPAPCDNTRHALAGLSAALCLGGLALGAGTENDPAKKPDREVIELTPIEVTGSIIKLAEAEGPAPVKIISRAEIEQSGHASFGEFMQQLPEAGYSSSNENVGPMSSAYRGMSVLNLRGFDPANTLVLVDGRRPVLSGIGWNGTMFVDLNRFPASMVERVEILEDCGAIYGSGAAAGVVNIILRKDCRHTEIAARYGNSFRTDVGEKSLSLLAGAGSERANLAVGVTYFSRGALRAMDTTFAHNADLTDRYAAMGPAYADRVAAGAFDLRLLGGPQARVFPVPGQRNGVNGVNIPGLAPSALITRLPGTGGFPGGILGSATPNFTAPPVSGTGGQFNAAAAATFVAPILTRHTSPSNYYNQNEFIWLRPEVERIGANLSLRHTVSPHLTVYGQFSYQHNRTYIEGSPSAVGAGEFVILPKTNYWNPFGVDVFFYWTPLELGPKSSHTINTTMTALLGARGTLAGRWHWDSGLSLGFDRNTEIYGGMISRRGLTAALARTTPDALNILGGAGYRNPAATIDSLRSSPDVQGTARAVAWDAKISGEILNLPVGPVSAGMSAEVRREAFGDRWLTTDLSDVLGNILDFSASNHSQTTWSMAAEGRVPLVKRGEHRFLYVSDLAVSGRFDDYSVGFASGVKPYLGLRVQPTRWLTLRASLARTFRAPTLAQLYLHASDQTNYRWEDVRRPMALTGDFFDGTSTLRTARLETSPELQPCHSRTWQYGFVVDLPGRWLKGLTLGATYSHLEETDSIYHLMNNPGIVIGNEVGGGSAEYLVREPGFETYTNKTSAPIQVLSGPNGATTAVAPGETVTVPGRISYIRLKFVNLALARAENCDISLAYARTVEPFGSFRLRSNLSYAIYTGSAWRPDLLVNQAGLDLYPRVRMQSSVAWTRGDWDAVLTNNYVGPYGDLNQGNKVEVDSYSTLGAQVSREFKAGAARWLAGTRLMLGVENALDQEPPLEFSNYGFRSGNVLRPSGRFFYAEIRKTY